MGRETGGYSYLEEGIRAKLTLREFTQAIACGAIDAEAAADMLEASLRERVRPPYKDRQ